MERIKGIVLFGLVLVSIISCKKEKDDEPVVNDRENFKAISEDHSYMEGELNSVFNTVDNVANEDSAISGKVSATVLPACATKTFDIPTKTLTVDFGTTNCLCADGLNRRGKVIAVFSGKYRTIGTTVTVTLDNYFVDDIQVKGSKTIVNLGNSTGNFKYSYEVKNAEAITPTGTITWETSGIIERIQGDSTFTPWDDVYSGVATSKGVNRFGNPYTVEVDTANPLIRKIDLNPLCWRNFVSGILTFTDNKSNVIVLDYDPANTQVCDKLAEMSINGSTPFTITLR